MYAQHETESIESDVPTPPKNAAAGGKASLQPEHHRHKSWVDAFDFEFEFDDGVKWRNTVFQNDNLGVE
ncbi:hypothetical protein Prudu_007782 [Prunus dulcis]|uniref:Uncharacterized protein n=1 Tax=Prunus dulcis TaxID=3755 RepID=A0A4Y1R2P3_PRUDU|nr:hypothetical protein Prudu_007782 [Prunus dulcis]